MGAGFAAKALNSKSLKDSGETHEIGFGGARED